MTELRRTRNEPHCQTQEEELEARRILLAGARKGDRKAKTELMESYGVKIYSEAERQEDKSRDTPLTIQTKSTPRIQDRIFDRSRFFRRIIAQGRQGIFLKP